MTTSLHVHTIPEPLLAFGRRIGEQVGRTVSITDVDWVNAYDAQGTVYVACGRIDLGDVEPERVVAAACLWLPGGDWSVVDGAGVVFRAEAA